MDVLLVNLCIRYETPRYVLPVGLGYIATALKNAGYEFDLLDIDVLRPTEEAQIELLSRKKYDVYMMGCIVTGYRYVKSICEMIREVNPSATIIVGNSVADSIPEILLTKTKADIAVFSEGDITIIELMKTLDSESPWNTVQGISYVDRDEVKNTGLRPLIDNIDELPFIDWDIFNVAFYNQKSPVMANEPCPIPYDDRVCMAVPTARGCAYRCSFCYHVFNGRPYRFRSARSIVKEIVTLKDKYGMNYINFWDELTFPNTRHCEEVVDLMLEADLGIFWNATVRGDLLRNKDRRLAEKMKAAGCVGLSYSLESANATILKAMNKKLDINRFLEQKYLLDDVGIATWTNLVIGYPQETEETIRQSMDFCYKHDIYPSTGYLLPQPSTPIYEYAIQHGYITDEEEYLLRIGDRQDLYLNMTSIDDETLQAIVVEGLDKINKKMELDLGTESLLKTTVKKDTSSKISRI